MTTRNTSIGTIFNRYFFTEMLPPFFLTTVFFTFVFLMAKILDITNLIINYQIHFLDVLLILLFYVPYFWVYVIPMAVMMGVLLTLLRLSADNEIAALKAGGVNIYQILRPVAALCTVGCLITAFMVFFALPRGRAASEDMIYKVATTNLTIGLKERYFNNNFKDIMLYVNKIDLKTNQLIDVFIHDSRSQDTISTVVAPVGVLLASADKQAFHLKLKQGVINQANLKGRSVNTIRFNEYEIRLDISRAQHKEKDDFSDEKALTLRQLSDYIDRMDQKRETATGDLKAYYNNKYYVALIEFHRKFALPFACVVLGFLAVPLGILSKNARPAHGLGLCIGFFMLYYLVLTAGFVFGETGYYPPIIGMWMPNIITGLIALYLFKTRLQ